VFDGRQVWSRFCRWAWNFGGGLAWAGLEPFLGFEVEIEIELKSIELVDVDTRNLKLFE
jgi:hypothetical protein